MSSLNSTSSVVNFGYYGWGGSPFTTDTHSWTLNSVTLRLELGSPDASIASVHLMSDNGGKPGVSLSDLGTKTIVTGAALYIFSPGTTVTLDPSKKYWVVVGAVGTNGGLNVHLSQTGMGSFTNSGVPGASMEYSVAFGATLGTNGPPAAWNPGTPGGAIVFEVEGTQTGGGGADPTLKIALLSAGQVYVTWPTNFTGYTLESATNLPATNWIAFTNPPTVIGDQFTQTVDPIAGRQFYRLRKP